VPDLLRQLLIGAAEPRPDRAPAPRPAVTLLQLQLHLPSPHATVSRCQAALLSRRIRAACVSCKEPISAWRSDSSRCRSSFSRQGLRHAARQCSAELCCSATCCCRSATPFAALRHAAVLLSCRCNSPLVRLFLFERMLQIQQCGARLDVLLLQLILQRCRFSSHSRVLGKAVTIRDTPGCGSASRHGGSAGNHGVPAVGEFDFGIRQRGFQADDPVPHATSSSDTSQCPSGSTCSAAIARVGPVFSCGVVHTGRRVNDVCKVQNR